MGLPELGTKVRFNTWMTRQNGKIPKTSESGRFWAPTTGPKAMEGMVTGWRVIQDGYTEGGGYDEPAYFVQLGTHRVLLVVTHPTQNPYRVRPEDVEVLS